MTTTVTSRSLSTSRAACMRPLRSHPPQGGAPIENGGELALLYALVFIYLAARGAGPVSVDARQRRLEPREVQRERVRAA